MHAGKPTFRLPDVAYNVCLQACKQWIDLDGTDVGLLGDVVEGDNDV